MAAARTEGSDKDWLESLAMIISDRPLETWSDSDLLAFEVNVGDLARRFANLEALQKESARGVDASYEARRVTITRADGDEYSDLVWVDRDHQGALEAQVDRLLEQLSSVNPEQQRHAIAVGLLERVLAKGKIEDADSAALTRKVKNG